MADAEGPVDDASEPLTGSPPRQSVRMSVNLGAAAPGSADGRSRPSVLQRLAARPTASDSRQEASEGAPVHSSVVSGLPRVL